MGVADDREAGKSQESHSMGLQQRHGRADEEADALMEVTTPTALGKDANDGSGSFSNAQQQAQDIEEIISSLPDWKQQLSLRGYIVGELNDNQPQRTLSHLRPPSP
jgi:hypothetical protein